MHKDSKHIEAFHANHALSTPEGQEVMDALLKDSFPDIYAKISKNVQKHKQVMDSMPDHVASKFHYKKSKENLNDKQS